MNIILGDYESVWHNIWPLNKFRSLWPIFYGPMILPNILKTVWCMNIILWDYESVWHIIWPKHKCRSLWPIFHDPVILPFILKTIWYMNTILWIMSIDPDVWPKNKCMSLWPIFHCPVILPYILKTIQWLNIILWDYESVWHDIWPQNNICRSLWPIYPGPLNLKTVWCIYIILCDNECNTAFAPKQCRSQWSIFFMVQWFCLVS